MKIAVDLTEWQKARVKYLGPLFLLALQWVLLDIMMRRSVAGYFGQEMNGRGDYLILYNIIYNIVSDPKYPKYPNLFYITPKIFKNLFALLTFSTLSL